MPHAYTPDRELRSWIAGQLLPGETCSLTEMGGGFEAVVHLGGVEVRASGDTPRRAVKDAHGALLRQVSPAVRGGEWEALARG